MSTEQNKLNVDEYLKQQDIFCTHALKNIFVIPERPALSDGRHVIDLNSAKEAFNAFLKMMDEYKKNTDDLAKLNTFVFTRETVLGIINYIENPDFQIVKYSSQISQVPNVKFDGMCSMFKSMLEIELSSKCLEKSTLDLDLSKSTDRFFKIDEDLDKYFQAYCKAYATDFRNMLIENKEASDEDKRKALTDLVKKYLDELHTLFPSKREFFRAIILINKYYVILTNKFVAEMKKNADKTAEDNKKEE